MIKYGLTNISLECILRTTHYKKSFTCILHATLDKVNAKSVLDALKSHNYKFWWLLDRI